MIWEITKTANAKNLSGSNSSVEHQHVEGSIRYLDSEDLV